MLIGQQLLLLLQILVTLEYAADSIVIAKEMTLLLLDLGRGILIGKAEMEPRSATIAVKRKRESISQRERESECVHGHVWGGWVSVPVCQSG